MTYSDKLRNPKWQKKRLQILERDNWCCQLCQDTETTLHVHHLKYNKEPWDADAKDLITYCEHCHSIVEHLKDDDVKLVKKTNNSQGLYFLVAACINKIDKENSFMLFYYHPNKALESIVCMKDNTVHQLLNSFNK